VQCGETVGTGDRPKSVKARGPETDQPGIQQGGLASQGVARRRGALKLSQRASSVKPLDGTWPNGFVTTP
jgi:hypothetical protein